MGVGGAQLLIAFQRKHIVNDSQGEWDTFYSSDESTGSQMRE